MISNLFFSICSFFYSCLLVFVFFSKKRYESLENKTYSILIITNFIGLLIGFICYLTVKYYPLHSILNYTVSRLYLIYLLTWYVLFTFYVLLISYKISDITIKTIKTIFIVIYFTCSAIVFILPLDFVSTNTEVYSYGLASNFLYFLSAICIIFWIISILKNRKNLKNKKYLPVFLFIIIGIIVVIFQREHPSLFLITPMEVFITFLMYFTIENPDLKMIDELNFAKDQAVKANNAKSDFLSSMSHEIRTPLNAIVGFSDCIIDANSIDEAKENARDIVEASNTLLEIVNGILDISKIEAGKIEIINSNYSPLELFTETEKLIRARMGDKNLKFTVNIAKDIPNALYGDHANIKKVMINLLTNAIKYTDEGYVNFDISTIKKDGVCRLIIAVEDSGRGIKKENIDKLFTKFERLDEERNTTIEGTGLGLAITKRLVELMGGKIVVQSVYGQGSKFTVALDQKICTEKIITEVKEEITTIDFSGKKILIVDDNKINLKVASKLLENYHPVLTLVESGAECIEKIKLEHFDLILLDDMMPNMSGVETLKQLKQDQNFNIPTIALTANAITGMKEKYLSDGFDDYLAKPIVRTELDRILKTFLK